MEIITHQEIDQALCGKPVLLEEGMSRIAFTAGEKMKADSSGLVHGGFIFGLADYAAMLAVNHPNVVLGAADVKFLKPVVVGDDIVAKAKVQEIKGKKYWVSASVKKGEETVFQGMFTCFVPDKHVLG